MSRKPTPHCLQCGDAIKTPRPRQEYCSTACRSRFNNRRKERGTALYDLKMFERYQRDEAAELNMLSKMNRACAVWRDEDYAHRDGRRSWGDARDWMARNPWIGQGVLKRTHAEQRKVRDRRQQALLASAMGHLHDTNMSPPIRAAMDDLRAALALGAEAEATAA